MKKNLLRGPIAALLFALSTILLIRHLYAQNNPSLEAIQEIQQSENESSPIKTYTSQEANSWETPFLLILLFAILYGIFISLTPCIYCKIPITKTKVKASKASWYNFLLSLAYVFGTATAYATLGLFVALSGRVIGGWLINPWFILFIISFFIYIAGAMLGIYEVYMPARLKKGKSIPANSSFIYTFFAGMIPETLLTPCLIPVILGLFLYVASRGNPLLGFITLFVFILAMGIVILLVQSCSATTNLLPLSNMWIGEIKKIFGFFLLIICIYFLAPLIKPYQTTLLIGGVILSAGIYYLINGYYSRSFVRAGIGILLLLIGIGFLIEGNLMIEQASIWPMLKAYWQE